MTGEDYAAAIGSAKQSVNDLHAGANAQFMPQEDVHVLLEITDNFAELCLPNKQKVILLRTSPQVWQSDHQPT